LSARERPMRHDAAAGAAAIASARQPLGGGTVEAARQSPRRADVTQCTVDSRVCGTALSDVNRAGPKTFELSKKNRASVSDVKKSAGPGHQTQIDTPSFFAGSSSNLTSIQSAMSIMWPSISGSTLFGKNTGNQLISKFKIATRWGLRAMVCRNMLASHRDHRTREPLVQQTLGLS
jgi:hypothetical protein